MNAAGNFSYALKQLVFALVAFAILLSATVLDVKQARVVAACIYALATDRRASRAARRRRRQWRASLAGISQASNSNHRNSSNPAFAILAAMFLADKLKHGFAGEIWTAIFLVPALIILLMQPDIGQTALLSALCVTMLFFAGISWLTMAGLAAGGIGDLRAWPGLYIRMCANGSQNF